MIDANGRETDSIQVMTDDEGAAYLNVAAIQVPQVQVLFEGVGIPYAVDEEPQEGDADNDTVAIKIGPDVSCDEVQRSLDVLD